MNSVQAVIVRCTQDSIVREYTNVLRSSIQQSAKPWNQHHLLRLLLAAVMVQILRPRSTLRMLKKTKVRRCPHPHLLLYLRHHRNDHQSNGSAQRELVGHGSSSTSSPMVPLFNRDLQQCRRLESPASMCVAYATKIMPTYQLWIAWLRSITMVSQTGSRTCCLSISAQTQP
jgi:hypothetical protein